MYITTCIYNYMYIYIYISVNLYICIKKTYLVLHSLGLHLY